MPAEDPDEPPKDRFRAVYLILLLHGVGMLISWNMFINAKSYFVEYKLSRNYTGEDTYYATYFLQSVGFASQIPNIIFHCINIFINMRGSLTPRVVFTICVEIVVYIATIVLAVVKTSNCPGVFFWTTMVTIVILNMVNGIYQNTILGIAGKLPLEYPGGVIIGSNVSGTIVSIIDLITIAASPTIKTAAIYYFVTALVMLVISLGSYFALSRFKFYRYYNEHQRTPTINLETAKKIPYWKIFKSAFLQLFNLFFLFFVTLSIFPAIQANIKKSDNHFIIPEKYYVQIMCYFSFNTTAVLGSILSNFIDWPPPRFLVIPVVLRVLFVPFFFLCNYQPTNKVRKVPVLIPNDWAYWVAVILLGFTSGHLSTKAMIYTTGSVEAIYMPVSAKFGAAVLVTGIFCGALFSMIFPCLVEL